MLAIDTNVVVRFLTKDHEIQSPQARQVLLDNDVLLLTSVVLETEWVLRSVYRYDPRQIVGGIAAICALPRVTLEAPEAVRTALDWIQELNLDFADALHLALSDRCEAFVTFDHDLVRRTADTAIPARLP